MTSGDGVYFRLFDPESEEHSAHHISERTSIDGHIKLWSLEETKAWVSDGLARGFRMSSDTIERFAR